MVLFHDALEMNEGEDALVWRPDYEERRRSDAAFGSHFTSGALVEVETVEVRGED
jgi:hypothetical protein